MDSTLVCLDTDGHPYEVYRRDTCSVVRHGLRRAIPNGPAYQGCLFVLFIIAEKRELTAQFLIHRLNSPENGLPVILIV